MAYTHYLINLPYITYLCKLMIYWNTLGMADCKLEYGQTNLHTVGSIWIGMERTYNWSVGIKLMEKQPKSFKNH